MPNNEVVRILGIDPGYDRLGIAVIDKILGKKEVLVFSTCIETDKKLPHYKRLGSIFDSVSEIIEEYKPQEASIETLFFSTNRKTALLVAEARGALLSLLGKCGVKTEEYTPAQVKIAVTGHGRSDKRQIVAIIPKLIALSKKIVYDDEYDAIAIALTHCACRQQKWK